MERRKKDFLLCIVLYFSGIAYLFDKVEFSRVLVVLLTIFITTLVVFLSNKEKAKECKIVYGTAPEFKINTRDAVPMHQVDLHHVKKPAEEVVVMEKAADKPHLCDTCKTNCRDRVAYEKEGGIRVLSCRYYSDKPYPFQRGYCKKCGQRHFTNEIVDNEAVEYDTCLGYLPGVAEACCGHGGRGYIIFKNGTRIAFDNLTVTQIDLGEV